MILSKLVFVSASLAGLGANTFASAFQYDDDLWLDARGLDVDEGYGYDSFARRAAEFGYGEDLDLDLYARDADADADPYLDLETALTRREVLAAVDSILARRGQTMSQLQRAHKYGVYPAQNPDLSASGESFQSAASGDKIPPENHAPEPPKGWRGAKEPSRIPGPKRGGTRKSRN